jgi:DNA-binding NarL/FixJ family response regulator
MRAAFEPSWTLLSDDERAAFSKLSVFRGGFTKEAAQAIAGTSLFVLSSLVDKSLLQIDSNGRYDLHELLRQYAAEKLDETPEVARRARDLHSRYYANFLFERQEELLHGNPKPMLIEIRQELENVRLAWNWMVVQVYADQIETTIVSLAMYYAHAGLYTEGEENFGLAADQLRERGGVALARALDFQGWCAYFLNHYEESKALYLESLPIYRESGVTDGIINCLLRLSDIARWSGNYAEARRLAEEGVREIEERGQDKRWMLTFLFGNLGEIAFLTGDYSEAQQYHEKSLAVAQEFGTQIGIADALNNLGKVHLAIKAYDEARRAYQRGLKRGKELDYERGVIVALSGLGEIALRTRALDEAKQHFQEALQLIAQRTIPRNLTLDALVRIAELLIEEEYFEPAIEILILCFRYPASQESTKQQAQLLLEQLQSRVPRDTFQRSFERTSPSRLDEVIVSLLNSAPFGRPAPQWLPPQDLLIGAPLTERELEILRLLAEGMSNSDIAQHLVLALSTVKWYLNIIYSKLEVANRTQAVARARQLHLLP